MAKREMTIEEAIEIFKEVREEVIAKETELSKQVFENLGIKAVDLAIKILEQQPCEDCISREDIINELKLGYFNKDLQEAKNDPCVIDAMIDWAIRIVKRQPSVTPKGMTITDFADRCRECGRIKSCEDYLKKRDKDYVHYNVKWLLDNWEQELELLSGGKIKPCDDCVSRQAVLDEKWTHTHPDGFAEEYVTVKDILELPSVTPSYNSIKTELKLCEDCISREAVINYICEGKECYKEDCKGKLYKRCPDLQWVYNLPSVTPKAESEE